MARLPAADQNSERDYATFTSHLWGDLDGWYNFWAERWRRTMDYLRSQHWRMLQEVDIKQIPDWRRFPIANFTLALYNDYLKNWLQSRVRFSAIPESPRPRISPLGTSPTTPCAMPGTSWTWRTSVSTSGRG